MYLEGLSQTLVHSHIDTAKTTYASKASKLSIEFPSASAEALVPLEQDIGSELVVNMDQGDFDIRELEQDE